MKDFIENVIRLMRFFVSSMLGLLFTVFGPFITLTDNKNRSRNFFIFFLLLSAILILSFVLFKMLDI